MELKIKICHVCGKEIKGWGGLDLQRNFKQHMLEIHGQKLEEQSKPDLVKEMPEKLKTKKAEKIKVDVDLNNDGKVDKKDRSLAAKFLGSKRRNKNEK